MRVKLPVCGWLGRWIEKGRYSRHDQIACQTAYRLICKVTDPVFCKQMSSVASDEPQMAERLPSTGIKTRPLKRVLKNSTHRLLWIMKLHKKCNIGKSPRKLTLYVERDGVVDVLLKGGVAGLTCEHASIHGGTGRKSQHTGRLVVGGVQRDAVQRVRSSQIHLSRIERSSVTPPAQLGRRIRCGRFTCQLNRATCQDCLRIGADDDLGWWIWLGKSNG